MIFIDTKQINSFKLSGSMEKLLKNISNFKQIFG